MRHGITVSAFRVDLVSFFYFLYSVGSFGCFVLANVYDFGYSVSRLACEWIFNFCCFGFGSVMTCASRDFWWNACRIRVQIRRTNVTISTWIAERNELWYQMRCVVQRSCTERINGSNRWWMRATLCWLKEIEAHVGVGGVNVCLCVSDSVADDKCLKSIQSSNFDNFHFHLSLERARALAYILDFIPHTLRRLTSIPTSRCPLTDRNWNRKFRPESSVVWLSFSGWIFAMTRHEVVIVMCILMMVSRLLSKFSNLITITHRLRVHNFGSKNAKKVKTSWNRQRNQTRRHTHPNTEQITEWQRLAFIETRSE